MEWKAASSDCDSDTELRDRSSTLARLRANPKLRSPGSVRNFRNRRTSRTEANLARCAAVFADCFQLALLG